MKTKPNIAARAEPIAGSFSYRCVPGYRRKDGMIRALGQTFSTWNAFLAAVDERKMEVMHTEQVRLAKFIFNDGLTPDRFSLTGRTDPLLHEFVCYRLLTK